MKSKLIITCACLGMLGSTVSCAGEEEATTVNAESASPQSDSDTGEEPAAKPAKRKGRKNAKRKAAEAETGENTDRAKMTNADCFPDSVPDSAPTPAKLCLSLAQSHPDMLFPKADYEGMPEDCKPLVLKKCK